MKAMIFAAGLGTRLKPFTDHTPKALVNVGGKPLLEHLILKLKNSGFEKIVINVHAFSQQIVNFLKSNNNFGVKILISDESDFLLETGGGIKKAQALLDDGEPFLVHNVDILSNVDLAAFYKLHTRQNLATLLVSERASSRKLLFDNENRLVGWHNFSTSQTKTPFKNLNVKACKAFAFSGIHVASPEIFPLLKNWNGAFSIIDFYLNAAKDNKIKGLILNDLKLLDVGKPETLKEAEKFLF